jgi:hemolysin activation/secretion protein
LLCAQAAIGDTLPDPTLEILRQQTREREERQRLEATPHVRLRAADAPPAERIPEDESPCFVIDRIVLEGDDNARFAFARSAIDRADDPAIGRCLGTRGIAAVMARAQNAIIARGLVTTRVLAQAQDLTDGTLVLNVVPGRVRSIGFSEESGRRANARNAMPMQEGDLLSLRDLEQGLENLRRLPSVETDIRILPGEAPGESDIEIDWQQRRPVRLAMALDDGGSRSTGKYLATAALSVDHPLGLNDLFYASYTRDVGGHRGKASGARDTRGHTLHYTVPYGYWSFSATTSENRFNQTVAGTVEDYRYSGTSENHELRLSRTLYRSARHRSAVSLRGYLNKSANFIEDAEIRIQRRRMAGWALGVQHRSFVGNATLDGALEFRRGTSALRAIDAPEEAAGEGTARPRVVSANAQLTLPLTIGSELFSYRANWRAQWHRTPLVPQDRVSIGGRHSVRGFDGETILLAERGWLVRNELAWHHRSGLHSVYAGLDHGVVGGPTAERLVGRRLTGAVIGARGNWQQLSWDAFVGWPLSRPDGFKAPNKVTGFHLSWSW